MAYSILILPPHTVHTTVRQLKQKMVQESVVSWGQKVSMTTIRSYLHGSGLFECDARNKPLFATVLRKKTGFAELWEFY